MDRARLRDRGDPGLDACPDAVVSVSTQGRVIRWNAACARLLGLPADAALGRPVTDVLSLTARDLTGRFPERQWASAGGGRRPVELTRWTASDGEREITHLCLRNARDRVTHEDEQARVVDALRRQARSDALTGLANRLDLQERLHSALDQAAARQVGLLVVDLDGFKAINDTHGHAVGDEVLAAVASRLQSCVRAEDTVARLGGDEFVVLTPLAHATDPQVMADRIRLALTDPITTSAGPLSVGASVGMAVSEPGTGPDDLLRRADKAMYRDKLGQG
jgi:diguanylate cyclase (GGDEF)-like protein/PAS domain S-box-containing protein